MVVGRNKLVGEIELTRLLHQRLRPIDVTLDLIKFRKIRMDGADEKIVCLHTGITVAELKERCIVHPELQRPPNPSVIVGFMRDVHPSYYRVSSLQLGTNQAKRVESVEVIDVRLVINVYFATLKGVHDGFGFAP